MRRRIDVFAVCLFALAGGFAADATAQSCQNVYGYLYVVRTTGCGALCSPGTPVTFTVEPYHSSYPISCVKAVTWDFGDGTPAATGLTAVHSFAAGSFRVKATVSMQNNTSYTHDNTSVRAGLGEVVMNSQNVQISEEATSPAKIRIARSNIVGETTVTWETGETASTVGVRYPTASGQVTIAAGQTTAEFDFAHINDSVWRGNYELEIKLKSASNEYLIGSPSTVRVFFKEDDPPARLQFDPLIVTVSEDVGLATISVRRDGDMNGTVGASYAVPSYSSNSSSVVRAAGTVQFGPGETTKTFTVAIVNDTLKNGRRDVSMQLENPTGGATLAGNSYWHSGILRILDDDGPNEPEFVTRTASLEDITIPEGDAGQNNDSAIALNFSGPLSADVQLSISVSNKTALYGSDWSYSWNSFTARKGDTRVVLPVTIIGDTRVENDETFTIEVQNYWSSNVLKIERSKATVTILNDDASLTPATATLARGSSAAGVIDVGSRFDADLVIPLQSSNAAVVQVPANVTLAKGETRATFIATSFAAGGAAVSAILPAARGGEKSMAVSVHDSGAFRFEPAHVSAFAGRDVTVRISLDPPSANPETITLRSSNPAVVTTPATVTIPAGGTGSFAAKMLKHGGTSIQAKLPDQYGGQFMPLLIDVTDAPDAAAIANITPPTGPAAGGSSFEANGSKLTSDCGLLFGGVPAVGMKVVSESLITGATPPHAPGTVDVELVCKDSRFILTNGFTYIRSTPSLRSVAPSFGTVSGGTHVRANGAHLYSGCWLFFGEFAARGVTTIGTAEMTALAPAGKAGSVDVSVRCDQQSAVLRSAFTYTSADEPSPSIASVDPLIGGAGQEVTITGLRFRPNDQVAFDKSPATILRTTPESHVVRIPELPLGKTSINLTDAAGRLTTTGPIFRIIEPMPPRIASATPDRVFAGSEVVLEGTGFRPGYTFAIGGSVAKIVSLDYARAVVRLAGNTPPGSQQIEVLNAAGQLAAVGPTLEVLTGGPAVISAFPACGSSEGGTQVTLLGTGFGDGTSVMINGVGVSATVINATEIRFVAPQGATGNATIAVTNANGDTTSNSDAFRYVSPFDPEPVCGPSRGRNVRH